MLAPVASKIQAAKPRPSIAIGAKSFGGLADSRTAVSRASNCYAAPDYNDAGLPVLLCLWLGTYVWICWSLWLHLGPRPENAAIGAAARSRAPLAVIPPAMPTPVFAVPPTSSAPRPVPRSTAIFHMALTAARDLADVCDIMRSIVRC